MNDYLWSPNTELAIRKTFQLRNLCLSLRNARLKTDQERFLAKFKRYLSAEKEIINPDPEAILVGFWEAIGKEDYGTIITVGDKLSDLYLWEHGELGAWYYYACKITGHQRPSARPEAAES